MIIALALFAPKFNWISFPVANVIEVRFRVDFVHKYTILQRVITTRMLSTMGKVLGFSTPERWSWLVKEAGG